MASEPYTDLSMASSDLTLKATFAEITDVWSQSKAGVHEPRIIKCDDLLTTGIDNAISTQVQLDKVIVTEAPIAEVLYQNVGKAPEPSEPEQNKEDANLLKENQTVELEPAIEPEPTEAPEITVEASSNVMIFRGNSSMQSGQAQTLEAKAKSEEKIAGRLSNPMTAPARDLPACSFLDGVDSEWASNDARLLTERLRCVIGVVAIEMGVTSNTSPLFALHIDRATVLIQHDSKGTKTVLSIADVQMDNLQFSSGQFDFGVVASTRAAPLAREAPPPIWSAFAARAAFGTRQAAARLLLRLRHDSWRVVDDTFNELTEVELSVGPLALYVEDSYVAALTQLARAAQPAAAPPAPAALALADTRALQRPLRLRLLNVHPLDLTLTLHTAVRMYIALDQSPLRLSAFQLRDMMTSAERLTHALTVHYLSAAILGAGWVVGGLELLGAPGALAARVGGATGGVRGVATATAAALLRSLSAWAGSLARNLDLLAGDEEHARRAAAARRRAPHSLVEGLAAGIANFAINILGAVGGLAHHPLVGVAVGESTSGAAALRRCLLGALAKPLSATADLVAFAGTGLLHQTGWDPVPQPRAAVEASEASAGGGASWRRDSVRWAFRLAELTALAGFDVLLDGAPLRLLLSHKYLVVADAESERIVEMIDLRFCSLGPYQGVIIELIVAQSKPKQKVSEAKAVDEDEEYQVNAAAMARVARYTGAEGAAPAGGAGGEARVLSLLPPPRHAAALHAALCAAVHNNADTHHHLL